MFNINFIRYRYILLIITAFIRIANAVYFCKLQCGLKPMNYIVQTVFPCIVQAGIMFTALFVIYTLYEESWSRFVFTLSVSVVLHPILAYFISFSQEEKKILKDAIKSKLAVK